MFNSGTIIEPRPIEAGALQTRIEPTLDSLSEEDLRAVTAEGHPFASAQWYRMLQQLDLSRLTGGDVQMQFVVVTSGGMLVAVCPFLRARGPELYALYSFRRYYFEAWLDEALRAYPDRANEFRRLNTILSWFRRLLEWMRCSLDDFLVVCSPLANRLEVPVRPDSPVPRELVFEQLLAALKRHARELGRPLWFLGVPEDGGPWPALLQAAGCQRVFYYFDNRIDLSQITSFDAYLQSRSKVQRKSARKEIRQCAQAGVTFRFVDDLTDLAGELSQLYANNYSKYNASNLDLRADFWTTLTESHGSKAETLVAEQGGRPIGFSLLLKSDVRREMVNLYGGRLYESWLGKTPFHFELLCYEPVRRAIELGYRSLWLGVAAYKEKLPRGAAQTPLHSYFWFPRRRDRWMLGRYLHECGETARREMANSAGRPLRIVPECAGM